MRRLSQQLDELQDSDAPDTDDEEEEDIDHTVPATVAAAMGLGIAAMSSAVSSNNNPPPPENVPEPDIDDIHADLTSSPVLEPLPPTPPQQPLETIDETIDEVVEPPPTRPRNPPPPVTNSPTSYINTLNEQTFTTLEDIDADVEHIWELPTHSAQKRNRILGSHADSAHLSDWFGDDYPMSVFTQDDNVTMSVQTEDDREPLEPNKLPHSSNIPPKPLTYKNKLQMFTVALNASTNNFGIDTTMLQDAYNSLGNVPPSTSLTTNTTTTNDTKTTDLQQAYELFNEIHNEHNLETEKYRQNMTRKDRHKYDMIKEKVKKYAKKNNTDKMEEYGVKANKMIEKEVEKEQENMPVPTRSQKVAQKQEKITEILDNAEKTASSKNEPKKETKSREEIPLHSSFKHMTPKEKTLYNRPQIQKNKLLNLGQNDDANEIQEDIDKVVINAEKRGRKRTVEQQYGKKAEQKLENRIDSAMRKPPKTTSQKLTSLQEQLAKLEEPSDENETLFSRMYNANFKRNKVRDLKEKIKYTQEKLRKEDENLATRVRETMNYNPTVDLNTLSTDNILTIQNKNDKGMKLLQELDKSIKNV